MAGRLRTAIFLLSVALAGCATGPGRDMALANQGRAAMEAGDMQTAESRLKEALAENPDNPYALTDLGALYLKKYRYERARPLFERVIMGQEQYEKAAKSDEASRAIARLVQLSRDNLELIDREEALDQEALALAPEPKAESAVTTPEPETRPEPLVAAAAPAGFGYQIQIGAFKSRERAERMSLRLKERHGNLFRDKELLLTSVGALTKVYVGPYNNMTEADNTCGILKKDGISCFPRKP